MAARASRVERYGQLDAVRGLAALAVFFGHCLGMLQPAPYSNGPVDWFMHSPFRIMVAGHQAVIFFFLLSGFVLSLRFYSGKIHSAPFLVGRVARLYPPYLCALIIAVGLRWLVPMHPLHGSSDWINGFWSAPLKPGQVWPAATMLVDVQGAQLNPTVWALIIEMRISLIFPIIMLILLRARWPRCLAVACVLGCMAGIASSSPTDLFGTVQYGFFFVAGAVLARNRDGLVCRCRALRGRVQLGLLAAAVLLYTQVFWLASSSHLHVQPIDDLVTAAGASLLIVLALAAPQAARVLPAALRRFGKSSYSFYLYHFLVLLTLAHLLAGHVVVWLIWLLALAFTVLVSTLMYWAIELPSIAAGHALANLLQSPASREAPLRTAA